MQVPETDVYWTYSLLNASESRASARTGTPAGAMAELAGIDGTNNGGISPFPGFRKMHSFAPENVDSAYGGSAFSPSNPYTSVAHRCWVVDFWSFSVVAGSSTRVFGFVYLARRPNDIGTPTCGSTYDLLMEFKAPNGSTTPVWKTILLKANIAATDASILAEGGKAVMSVETTGKAVYVFRRGVAPIAVYFKTSGSPVTGTVATVVNPAGPGVIPKSTLFSGNFGNSSVHDPSNFPNPSTSGNPLGSVVFATTTSAPNTGGGSYLISNFSTAPELLSGNYSLAVQFEDTRSGRKSQLTRNIDLTFTGGGHVLIVDGVYNSDYYDTVNVYRSVRTANAAGAYTGGILQLEAQVTLSAYNTSSLPASGTMPSGTNVKYFRYAYQLTDNALVMQDVFLDKPSYSETMPKGGAGALLDGTMLVGNISESPSDLTGTGETRWSASGMDSPELFTALGQYKPSSVGDAVTCFRRTGQIMSGFTRNGVQFFSKQDGFVKVLAAHQGYGITGPYAAATVGPVTYYLNYRGLKAVYPDGRLDDVQAINQVVANEWYSNTTGAQELSKVSIAFDPATLCLFILNPVRQQSVLFWFATGVVSQLEDMSFGKVTGGWWEDDDGQLVPRALFLFNAPYPDAVTNTNFRPGVFMPSRSYQDKTYPETGVNTQVSMLDADILRNPQSTVSFTNYTYSYFDSTCTWQTGGLGFRVSNAFTTSAAEAARMIGMWVYVTYPLADITEGANRARVVDANGTYVWLDRRLGFTGGKSLNMVADPMYVRVMPAALELSGDKGEEFVVKQPSSMGVVLTDVELPTDKTKAPVANYWVARMFRENEITSTLSGYPTSPDGTSVSNAMIRGDSPNWAPFGKHGKLAQWWFPCFETFMANVRYRLVGLQVKGRMLPTDRTRRTY